MYNNIGNKIKGLTKIITIIGWVIAGIMIFSGLVYIRDEGVIFLLLGLLYGFLTWVSSWFIYAFGELVQNSTDIRNFMLSGIGAIQQEPITTISDSKMNELNNLRYSGLITEYEYNAKIEELLRGAK